MQRFYDLVRSSGRFGYTPIGRMMNIFDAVTGSIRA